MTPVTVYSKPNCVQCKATYRHLDKAGVPYASVDITEDTDARDYVLSLGHLTAPVVVTATGTHWSGYVPDAINALVK